MQCLLEWFGLRSKNLEVSGKGFTQGCEISWVSFLMYPLSRHLEVESEIKVLREQLESILVGCERINRNFG